MRTVVRLCFMDFSSRMGNASCETPGSFEVHRSFHLFHQRETSVKRGMSSVKKFEFDVLPQEGGWDYIYLNDEVQGSGEDM